MLKIRMSKRICKTKDCKRNSVPEGFGYCNVCFTRIMEIRKIKALERIAKNLEKLNINSGPTKIIHERIVQESNKPKNTVEECDDFIPSIDISKISSGGMKVETKTDDSKNIKNSKEKLSNI